MKTLSRRDFLKVSGVAAASVAATAVLGPGLASASSLNMDTREGEMQAGEGVQTGILPELTYGSASVFASLTPFRNTNAQHFQCIKHLYDRLVYLDGDFNYSPQAAKEIKVSEDGVTFDIEIYDNIMDSEGNHITAADVVWFIEQYMSNGLKTYFGKIDHVAQTGDYTLQVVMKADIAELSGMAFASTFMVSQKAYEASADGFATYVVSTSPYKVAEFVPSSTLTMERRDDYWMPEEIRGKYYTSNIQKLTCLAITEVSQMQIALETGTVQVYPAINTTVAKAFINNPDYTVVTSPSNNGYVIFFSGDAHSPLANNADLRKALCYAIDQRGVIQGALDGYGEPMYDICCRTCSGYVNEWEGTEYYPFSMEKAAECLKQSGYKGEELNFAMTTSMQKVGTILQAYWMAAGINVKLDVRDLALFGSITPAEYDIYMTMTGNGVANLWSQFLDGNGYPYGDRQGRNDETLNELLYYTWQNANYTPENISKVRDYLIDVCYGFGVCLPLQVNVISKKCGMVTTVFNTQGYIDVVNCEYQA